MNSSLVKFLGIVGLVIFLFGIVGGFFTGHDHFIMQIHMILGVGLLAAWFGLYGSKNLAAAPVAVKGREARFGLNVFLFSIVFIGILAAINFLGAKDRYNFRWDSTEQGVFSLSDQTQKVLKDLKSPLKLAVFNVQGLRGQAFEQVKLYAYYSDKVKVEVVDPNAKPHLIEKYGMKPGNLIYIEYGAEGTSKVESRLNDMTEESITNAIVKLTKGAAKKIYYLTGHSEPDLKGTDAMSLKYFADSVADENLAIEELSLAQRGTVPSDAAALIVVAPKTPLFPEEKKAILAYADGGGKLLLAVDPMYPSNSTDIKDIASNYGIEVGNNVLLDAQLRMFAGPTIDFQFMVASIESHAITEGMSQRDKPIVNLASSVTIKENKQGATYHELLKTSPAGWAESDIQAIFTQDQPEVGVGDSDIRGPVSLAIAYEKEISGEGDDKKFTRVLVIGDTDWMNNALYLQVASHRDLALNSLNWLIGEHSAIAIRPKKFKASIARVPQSTFTLVMGSGFLIPEIILILGLLIWWRRRIA
jgi:ABC-type uncharacterized transport system involved in gliding motility auxiliary subunit